MRHSTLLSTQKYSTRAICLTKGAGAVAPEVSVLCELIYKWRRDGSTFYQRFREVKWLYGLRIQLHEFSIAPLGLVHFLSPD